MKNEIITLEQLPIIKYKLEELSKEIKNEVDKATKLVATVDNIKEIKEVRAKLNKDFNELETQRKQVKQAIMSKYDEFEKIYKENVSELYSKADNDLKEKVNTVESGLKEIGISNIRRYFDEYKDFLHLNDIIQFEDLNLNITLTNLGKNLDGNKYKEEIKQRLDSIANDIALINLEEFKEEIMLEYKTCLDFAKAKLIVVNRHSAIDSIRVQQEEKNKQIEEDKKIEEKVEEIVAPVEVIEDNEIISVTFTVTGTKEKIKELKNKIIELELEYE